MKKVIIFNAPPRAGKDTAAKLLLKHMDANLMCFKQPLHEMVARLLGIDLEAYLALYEMNKENELVELKHLLFGKEKTEHYTLRELYIHLSENVIKPVFGSDIFGKVAADNLKEGWNVFTDGGFKEEILAVYHEVDELYIIQLYRDGCDFSCDSRSYMNIEVDQTFKIYNNHSVSDLENKLRVLAGNLDVDVLVRNVLERNLDINLFNYEEKR